MRRIAHIADLHFDRVAPGLAEALLADLAAQKPDVVAVAGDLTLRGLGREFRAALAFLNALPAPFVAVPGNHDIPRFDLFERFTDPFRAWRRHVGPSTEPVWHDEELVVAGLNTVRRLQFHADWSAGRISRLQVARLEARLAALRGRSVVIVAHHPPTHPPGHGSRPLGRADLLPPLFRRAEVRALLTGHLHRHRNEIRDGTLFLDAATALSTRMRGEPNGYNLLDIDGPSLRVIERRWNGTAFS